MRDNLTAHSTGFKVPCSKLSCEDAQPLPPQIARPERMDTDSHGSPMPRGLGRGETRGWHFFTDKGGIE
jgi:hypothetical protein